MTTLSDRYVWAASRTLPEPQRPEFGRELRERIGDSIDSRIERGTPPAEAEWDALAELGDPAQLAATYVDRPLQLIGPRYFLTWWRLLKTLLILVLPIATAGVLLGQLISGAPVGQVIGTTVVAALSTAMQMCFWTTLAFALIERSTGASEPVPTWMPDQLPQADDEARAGRLGDLIGSLVFLTLFAAAIVWQQFGVVFRDGVREPIPVLDPALWRFWIPYFLGLLVLEALFAVQIFRRGWNRTMAGLNVPLNVAFTVPMLWLFLSGQLLDPAFLEAIRWPWGEGAGTAAVSVIVCSVIGVALWDVADGFVKAARHRGGSMLGGY
jgi:hypothetical protein